MSISTASIQYTRLDSSTLKCYITILQKLLVFTIDRCKSTDGESRVELNYVMFSWKADERVTRVEDHHTDRGTINKTRETLIKRKSSALERWNAIKYDSNHQHTQLISPAPEFGSCLPLFREKRKRLRWLTRVGLEAECLRWTLWDVDAPLWAVEADAVLFGRLLEVWAFVGRVRCCRGAFCSTRDRTRFSASLFVRRSLCTDWR